jgi:hypothetical protein
MNLSAVKLFLGLLWLVPGIGFLLHDLVADRTIGVPFGRLRLPLSVPCLILATFNLMRWWWDRSRPGANQTTTLGRRARQPRLGDEGDPVFRFDDPVDEPTPES